MTTNPQPASTSRSEADGHAARKAMTETSHVVGPGVLRVRNGMPAWEPIEGQPLVLHPERLRTLLIYGHGDLTGAALKLLWQHGVQAYAAAIGLDPLIGVYHQRRAGKPALACDLIEPLRTPVVDQLVLAEVRQGAFRPEHFHNTENGVRLNPDAFRRFLQVFEARYGGQPQHATFEQQARQIVDQFAAAVRQWERNPP